MTSLTELIEVIKSDKYLQPENLPDTDVENISDQQLAGQKRVNKPETANRQTEDRDGPPECGARDHTATRIRRPARPTRHPPPMPIATSALRQEAREGKLAQSLRSHFDC